MLTSSLENQLFGLGLNGLFFGFSSRNLFTFVLVGRPRLPANSVRRDESSLAL